MRKEYDFSTAKRAKDVPHLARLQANSQQGKTRITMWVDEDVIAAFRARAEQTGTGYQTEINRALRQHAEGTPLTAENLQRSIEAAVLLAFSSPASGAAPSTNIRTKTQTLSRVGSTRRAV